MVFPSDRLGLLAQDNGLGDGRIDNFIIDSSAHVISGVIVLVTMTLALVLCGRRAIGGHALDVPARWSVLVAQVSLGVQALLGIKLLDQGQGISQLYIHYVGGLMPLGAFLAGGWLINRDTVRGTRWLTLLVAIGWFSAVMAFFIGRAYVNR